MIFKRCFMQFFMSDNYGLFLFLVWGELWMYIGHYKKKKYPSCNNIQFLTTPMIMRLHISIAMHSGARSSHLNYL